MINKASVAMISMLVLAGCSKEEPTTYEVPKEKTAPPAVQSMGSDAEKQAVMAAHAATEMGDQGAEMEVKLPEGWTEKPASGMRQASYVIEGTSIDFYLTSLSMGDVPSNVNRWRGQVGLSSATPEEIASELVNFDAGGHAVNYIEIYNEEGGKGIIAAIVDLSPKYWYFTAKGSVDELKAHAGDIRSFLETMKIH